jgi:hypothetical protein
MRLLLFLLLLHGGGVIAQEPPADTVQVIALHAQKKQLPPDYDMDALVRNLNQFNPNPRVVYVVSTEDDTRTGFYAHYYVQFSIEMTPPQVGAPILTRVAVQDFTTKMVRSRDGSFQTVQRPIMRYENRYENGPASPGKAACYFRIREKWNNEKVETSFFKVAAMEQEDLDSRLLVQLIEQLFGRFAPADNSH